MDDPGPAVVALISGATTFFFSLAEAALIHYSPPRLLDIARRKNREAAIPAFIDADQRVLLTCRTLAVIGSVAFALAVLVWMWGEEPALSTWHMVEAGAVASAVLLTVGRLLPLYLGRLFAEPVLLAIRPVLVPAHMAFGPLTFLLYLFRGLTERLAGRPLEGDGAEHIQEEILSVVEEGEMEGVIGEDEAEMIERALHLRDADVADAMTPRTDMFSLQVETPIDKAVRLVSAAGHSRVPIYEKNPDQIVGILYGKDLLLHWGTPEAKDLTLTAIARKTFFVPETKKISQLLEEFRKSKMHMAVVLDEYGGTAGLITIEDILEEIVGEIEDEYDESEDLPALERKSDAEAEVDGRIHVDELADVLDVKIPSDEFDSVGGLVFTVLGRIPTSGEEFDYAGMHFTVLNADERRVIRVQVVRTSP